MLDTVGSLAVRRLSQFFPFVFWQFHSCSLWRSHAHPIDLSYATHVPADPFIPISPPSVLCAQSCGSSHSDQVVVTVTAVRTSRRQRSRHSSSSSSSLVFLSDSPYASCSWMVSLPWIRELFFFDFLLKIFYVLLAWNSSSVSIIHRFHLSVVSKVLTSSTH